MSEIKWKTTEQTSTQNLISQDGKWHITKTQKGQAAPEFTMTCPVFFPGPTGRGKDYRTMLNSFLDDCNRFACLLTEAKTVVAEHLAHLEEMENTANVN